MPASRPDAKIEVVDTVDQTLIDSLRRLYGQLYPDLSRLQVEATVGEQTLAATVGSPTDILLVVKDPDGRIVGTATLNLVYRPPGRSAYIETFVIDQDHRGRGLGRLLLDRLVELAAKNQAWIISLASSKQRLVSHRLYEGAGFKQDDSFYYSRRLDQSGSD